MVYAAQLADMGQTDAAFSRCKSMLKGTPDDREVYISLAQMYSRLKRWTEAEEAPEQGRTAFHQAGGQALSSIFCVARPTSARKNTMKRKRCSAKSWPAIPQNATTLNYLGYMLADRGVKLEEALSLIKKAVDLDPANGAYLDSLGWAYFKLGKYDQAEDSLIKASQRMGTDPTVQDHLGDLYQKTGRLKLAAAHWERALSRMEQNRRRRSRLRPR